MELISLIPACAVYRPLRENLPTLDAREPHKVEDKGMIRFLTFPSRHELGAVARFPRTQALAWQRKFVPQSFSTGR